jgi:hypothetical protein
VNYFAPLSHGERIPVTRDQVWSGLRGHRRLACAARKKIFERQITEDAQVKQDESLTRNIVYDGASGDGLHGYSDSSLGDQADDRHSTSGYVFLLADRALSWSSHKQKTVAQNTTEAEYMAMTDTANQAAWYESFLTELGYEVDDPIPLHGDNKGAIDLALNPVTGRRSKHIAIRHHVIREYIEKGTISLICTPTAEMVADSFTKSLPRALLLQHNNDMGLSA